MTTPARARYTGYRFLPRRNTPIFAPRGDMAAAFSPIMIVGARVQAFNAASAKISLPHRCRAVNRYLSRPEVRMTHRWRETDSNFWFLVARPSNRHRGTVQPLENGSGSVEEPKVRIRLPPAESRANSGATSEAGRHARQGYRWLKSHAWIPDFQCVDEPWPAPHIIVSGSCEIICC